MYDRLIGGKNRLSLKVVWSYKYGWVMCEEWINIGVRGDEKKNEKYRIRNWEHPTRNILK
jgi:hypothetical protein